MTSIHDFKKVTDSLGIYPGELGVIMLDFTPLDNPGIPKEWEYNSSDPEKWWVKGFVGQNAHMSLLYGLLQPAAELSDQINTLLEGLPLPQVETVEATDFTQSGDLYSAIVLKVKVSSELMEFHRRLSYLPHVDTFTPWVPHVTVAYVNAQNVEDTVALVKENLVGKTLMPVGLNLGDAEH